MHTQLSTKEASSQKQHSRMQGVVAALLCCALALPLAAKAQSKQEGSTLKFFPELNRLLTERAQSRQDGTTTPSSSSSGATPSSAMVTTNGGSALPIRDAGTGSGGNSGSLTIREAGTGRIIAAPGGIVDVPYQGGSGTVVPRGNTGTSGTNGTRYTNAGGSITSAQGVADPTGGYLDSLGKVVCESIPGTVYRNNRCQCSSGTWNNMTMSCGGSGSSGGTSNTNGEAENCDTSEAIKSAINIHTEMASVVPVLDKIFEANEDCFAGASGIFDLSPTIPSLLDLITSAVDALKRYAQEKICTAINEITKYINAPISIAIQGIIKGDHGTIANMTGSMMSGLVNDLVTGTKGGKYHERAIEGVRYRNTNMFNLNTMVSRDNSKEIQYSIEENNRQIERIQKAIEDNALAIADANNAVSRAESALRQCDLTTAVQQATGKPGKACSAEQTAYENAMAELSRLEGESSKLLSELSTYMQAARPRITATPMQTHLTEEGFANECPVSVIVKDGVLICPVSSHWSGYGARNTQEAGAGFTYEAGKGIIYGGGNIRGVDLTSGSGRSSGSSGNLGKCTRVNEPGCVNGAGQPCGSIDIMYGRCIRQKNPTSSDSGTSGSGQLTMEQLAATRSGGNASSNNASGGKDYAGVCSVFGCIGGNTGSNNTSGGTQIIYNNGNNSHLTGTGVDTGANSTGISTKKSYDHIGTLGGLLK